MPINAHLIPFNQFHQIPPYTLVNPMFAGHFPAAARSGGLFPPAPLIFGPPPLAPTMADVHRHQIATAMAFQSYYRSGFFCNPSSIQSAAHHLLTSTTEASSNNSPTNASLLSQSPTNNNNRKRHSSSSPCESAKRNEDKTRTAPKFDFTKLGESIAEDNANKSRTVAQLPAPVPTHPVWSTAVFPKPWYEIHFLH